jgi:ribosomal-protein-alanine N-acetyltransferase
MVLREDGVAMAYAGVWFVLDEGHITNIAVHPDRRGIGYGEKVTRAMIQLAADSGMNWMTLEVRRSNIPAINLYHKLGFIDVGYRKRYYEHTEDALIMALERLPEGNPENDPMLVRE